MTLAGLAAEGTDARCIQAVTPQGLVTLLDTLPPAQAMFLRATGFAAQAHRVAMLPGPEGLAGAVLGLGDESPANPLTYGSLAGSLPEGSVWHLGEGMDPAAATLGWVLGAYRFDRYRGKPGRRHALLVPPGGVALALAQAQAICLGRDLINTPAEDCGPAELAAAVTAMAARHGATCDIVEGAAVATGFPALHAAGRAATPGRAPRVAILRWGNPAHPLLALCGKGVCFDTGGLDLKPPEAMRRMKKDMGGAALMLALAETLMAMQAPWRILLLIGAVENAVGPDAFRPGDVLRTRKGLTVEVGNTDAEGRLVLADLLAYAAEQAPELTLDAATLTGAARVALGPDLPAMFSNNTPWAEAILAAGEAVNDPLWRLPLHEAYDSWLDSPIADMNNVATRPMAGAVVAAMFLRRFVSPGLAWVHLDTYAWNDVSRPGRPEGGECPALRALTAALLAETAPMRVANHAAKLLL